MKKILKWLSISLLSVIVIFIAIVAMRQHRKFSVPYPNIHASTDSNIINRGKHLVLATAHCANCHGKPAQKNVQGTDPDLSGGVLFDLPLGKIYSPNLTPGKGGIGTFSDREIARVLRYGVRPDGTAMLDIMPFHNTSDEDLQAIISYLRQLKPVNRIQPKTNFSIPGKIVNAFLISPVPPIGQAPASVKKDSIAAYGKYLATSLTNCRGCHTNRNLLTGAFTGIEYAGGLALESKTDSGTVIYTTPNLTTGADSRINGWSREQFIARFRKGRLLKESHMPWESFSRMDDIELTAIYKYLKTLPPATAGIKNYIQFKKK